MNEEVLLEDQTFDDVDTSSDPSVGLIDRLDRIEALLNEDIALRTSESGEGDQDEVLVTESGVTGSGAIADPNYSQYIYDYLSDSTVKVEIVGASDPTIFNKQLNEYTVLESLLVIGLAIAFSIIAAHFIEKYVFKFRR